jgi:transposase
MFRLEKNARVWLVLGRTDMRKAINGLSGLVANTLEMDPMSGHYFVFSGRRKNTLKVLYWDKNGYALWYKRLEVDKFFWPSTEAQARAITGEQMQWLLAGLNIEQAHRHRRYAI